MPYCTAVPAKPSVKIVADSISKGLYSSKADHGRSFKVVMENAWLISFGS